MLESNSSDKRPLVVGRELGVSVGNENLWYPVVAYKAIEYKAA